MISDEGLTDHVVTRDRKTNKLSYVSLSQDMWLTELLSLDQHYDKDGGLL